MSYDSFGEELLPGDNVVVKLSYSKRLARGTVLHTTPKGATVEYSYRNDRGNLIQDTSNRPWSCLMKVGVFP